MLLYENILLGFISPVVWTVPLKAATVLIPDILCSKRKVERYLPGLCQVRAETTTFQKQLVVKAWC